MLELRYAFRAHHVQMALAKLEVIRAMLPQSRPELHRGLDKFFPVHMAGESSLNKEQQRSREMQVERWRNSLPQKKLPPPPRADLPQPLPPPPPHDRRPPHPQHRPQQPMNHHPTQQIAPPRPVAQKTSSLIPIFRSRQYTHPVLHSIHSHVMLQQNAHSTPSSASARNNISQHGLSERLPLSPPLNVLGAQLTAKVTPSVSQPTMGTPRTTFLPSSTASEVGKPPLSDVPPLKQSTSSLPANQIESIQSDPKPTDDAIQLHEITETSQVDTPVQGNAQLGLKESENSVAEVTHMDTVDETTVAVPEDSNVPDEVVLADEPSTQDDTAGMEVENGNAAMQETNKEEAPLPDASDEVELLEKHADVGQSSRILRSQIAKTNDTARP